MKNFFIYTDGACKGNPGNGGFAYSIYDELNVIWYEGRGIHKNTTNNQMELLGAIEALKVLIKSENNFNVEVFSDSAYVVNCFNEKWIEKWEKNGWKTRDNQDVANKDFWVVLKNLVDISNAKFTRVKRSDEKIKKVDARAKLASKSI